MNENSRKNEMQLDELLDSILQKNMDELVPKEEDTSDADIAAHKDRMLIARAKKEEKEQILLDTDEIDIDPFAVEEAIIEEAEEEEDEPEGDETSESEDVRVIEVAVGDEEDKHFNGKDLISLLMYVGVILVLTFCIVHFVGQRTRVSGSSMESTLSDGDNLLVDKLSYRLGDPERFDIIIFPYQYAENTYYIKRIIGLPGETVQIDTNGNIFIDGELLEEDYGLEIINDPGRAIDPVTLGEDEYFVLGDNRNNSSDSRFEGVANVKRDTIVGKAFLRIYPFNEITKL